MKHRRVLKLALTRTRALKHAEWSDKLEESVTAAALCAHLDNDAVRAHVDDTTAELLSETDDAAHVVALDAQSLGRAQRRGCLRSGVRGSRGLSLVCRSFGENLRGDSAAWTELRLFKVLGSKDRDLAEHQLALDHLGLRVVQHGPDGDL